MHILQSICIMVNPDEMPFTSIIMECQSDQYKFTVILGHTKWLIDQRITCDGKAHADIQCLESFTWAFKGTLTLVRGVRAATNYE